MQTRLLPVAAPSGLVHSRTLKGSGWPAECGSRSNDQFGAASNSLHPKGSQSRPHTFPSIGPPPRPESITRGVHWLLHCQSKTTAAAWVLVAVSVPLCCVEGNHLPGDPAAQVQPRIQEIMLRQVCLAQCRSWLDRSLSSVLPTNDCLCREPLSSLSCGVDMCGDLGLKWVPAGYCKPAHLVRLMVISIPKEYKRGLSQLRTIHIR